MREERQGVLRFKDSVSSGLRSSVYYFLDTYFITPGGEQNVKSTFVYFGSQLTYPLLIPFTSLTTISNALKSRTVTASNPTSNKTSAHSKKAYFV